MTGIISNPRKHPANCSLSLLIILQADKSKFNRPLPACIATERKHTWNFSENKVGKQQGY